MYWRWQETIEKQTEQYILEEERCTTENCHQLAGGKAVSGGYDDAEAQVADGISISLMKTFVTPQDFQCVYLRAYIFLKMFNTFEYKPKTTTGNTYKTNQSDKQLLTHIDKTSKTYHWKLWYRLGARMHCGEGGQGWEGGRRIPQRQVTSFARFLICLSNDVYEFA